MHQSCLLELIHKHYTTRNNLQSIFIYELFILLYVMPHATLKAVAVLLNLTVPQTLRLRCYVVLIKLA